MEWTKDPNVWDEAVKRVRKKQHLWTWRDAVRVIRAIAWEGKNDDWEFVLQVLMLAMRELPNLVYALIAEGRLEEIQVRLIIALEQILRSVWYMMTDTLRLGIDRILAVIGIVLNPPEEDDNADTETD